MSEHTQGKLSGPQEAALEWLDARGGLAPRKEWRGAGIAVRTMASLRLRGMVDWGVRPFGGTGYGITTAGRAAIARATGGKTA